MPFRKRYAYHKKRIAAKKNIISETIMFQSSTKNVTPESKPTDRSKETTFQRELKGLSNEARYEKPYVRAESGNRLVDWDSLRRLIVENTKCKNCGGEVDLSETTIGISTVVSLSCRHCKRKNEGFSRRTNYKELGFHQNASESYAINCQYVLGLMQMGAGNAESETLLNFLDLPHGSTFKKTTFGRIQTALRNEIKNISDQSMIDSKMRR